MQSHAVSNASIGPTWLSGFAANTVVVNSPAASLTPDNCNFSVRNTSVPSQNHLVVKRQPREHRIQTCHRLGRNLPPSTYHVRCSPGPTYQPCLNICCSERGSEEGPTFPAQPRSVTRCVCSAVPDVPKSTILPQMGLGEAITPFCGQVSAVARVQVWVGNECHTYGFRSRWQIFKSRSTTKHSRS